MPSCPALTLDPPALTTPLFRSLDRLTTVITLSGLAILTMRTVSEAYISGTEPEPAAASKAGKPKKEKVRE